MCDRLLLLKSGGELVYFGDIGSHAKTMLRYFYELETSSTSAPSTTSTSTNPSAASSSASSSSPSANVPAMSVRPVVVGRLGTGENAASYMLNLLVNTPAQLDLVNAWKTSQACKQAFEQIKRISSGNLHDQQSLSKILAAASEATPNAVALVNPTSITVSSALPNSTSISKSQSGTSQHKLEYASWWTRYVQVQKRYFIM